MVYLFGTPGIVFFAASQLDIREVNLYSYICVKRTISKAITSTTTIMSKLAAGILRQASERLACDVKFRLYTLPQAYFRKLST